MAQVLIEWTAEPGDGDPDNNTSIVKRLEDCFFEYIAHKRQNAGLSGDMSDAGSWKLIED